MSYLYGGSLGDVLTVAPLNIDSTVPDISSVTDLALNQPTTFTVKLPSCAPTTFSTNQKLLIGAAVAAALFLSRGRR